MHQRNSRLASGGTLIVVLGLLSACGDNKGSFMGIQTGQLFGGGTKQIADVKPVPGFLPKPDLLAPGGAGRADLVYLNPTVNFASYNKVLLEPVVVRTGAGSDLASVPPQQREALANTAYSDMYKALSKECHMVKTAAPNTIRLRFALVDAKATNVTENTLATYTPFVSTGYNVGSIAFNNGVGYFAGTATAEGYGEDAKTGKVLWQAVDRRGGTTSLAENTLNSCLMCNTHCRHGQNKWRPGSKSLGFAGALRPQTCPAIGLADLAESGG